MKSIAIESAPIVQWKSEFSDQLPKPEFFNSIFPGGNISAIKDLVKEIPTDKERFIEQFFKLPEEVLLPIFKNLLGRFSYSREAQGFIAELAEQLFKLQPDVLHPLITTHGADLINKSGLSEKVFIEKIFELPEDTLYPIITSQAVALCKASTLSARDFIDKLFALDTNILYSLIRAEGHELLKASNDKSTFIEKLFNLPPEVLHPFIITEGINLLKTSGQYSQKIFLTKLFALPPEILHPFISTQPREFMNASIYNEKLFINQLCELPDKVLKPILTNHAAYLLKLAAKCNITIIIKKLFNLPEDVLYPIIKEKVVELFKASGSNSVFIEQLFKLPQDVLHPILNENVTELMNYSYDKEGFVNKLFESKEEFLRPLLESKVIELTKTYSKSDNGKFINKLFALPASISHPVVIAHVLELMNICINKPDFIEQLFKLPIEVLGPVLTDKSVELLTASSPYFKQFIKKLFDLPPEILHPILTEHALELMNIWANTPDFMEQLFKLPIEVLGPVLTDKSVELLTASNPYFKQFIEKLFNLPTEVLQPILTEHALELMNVCGYEQKIFVEKLNALPEAIIKSIFTQDNLTKFFEKYTAGSMNLRGNDLYPLFQQHQLTMPAEAIKNLILQSDTSISLLKFTSPAISLINSIDSLHPTIRTILTKTYFQMEGAAQRKEFIGKWVEGLQKIIESNDSIAMILEKTVDVTGDIFMVNSTALPGTTGINGVCHTDTLNIYVATERNLNAVLATLVHESTHKLIQITHNNDALPYAKGSSFEEMEKAIATELEIEKTLKIHAQIKSGLGNAPNINSWLTRIMENYPAEKIAIELLPHFTAQITESILNNEAIEGVSSSFATLVWKYMHEQLPLSNKLPNLPALSYHSFVLTDDLDLRVVEQVTKILASGDPSHKWLDSDAGKLAFKVLSYVQKDSYFKQLFELPKDELTQILTSHLIPLIECSGDNKFVFVYELSKLSLEVVTPAITTQTIQLLESLGADNVWSVLRKLEQLPEEQLLSIFEINPYKFLEACGAYKFGVINKLLEFPSEKLLPILTTYGEELIKMDDGSFQFQYMQKFIELQLDTSAYSFTITSPTMVNYHYQDGIKVVYSDSFVPISCYYDDEEERDIYVGDVLSILNESFQQTLGYDLPRKWALNFIGYIEHDWDMSP